MSIPTGSPQPTRPSAVDPSPAEAKSNPRMENAAHQFEASLMQELFAPLQHDALFAGDDEEHGSGSALTGFASEAMARAVSDRGGFSIARQLIQHFEQVEGRSAGDRTEPRDESGGHSEKMGALPPVSRSSPYSSRR